MLVIVAPHANDARAVETRSRLEARACQVADRQPAVADAPARGTGRIADQTLTREEADAVRARFGVAAQDFLVVLIGKDGGEKRRFTKPPAPDEIFSTIDAMPMRRSEMRARVPACQR